LKTDFFILIPDMENVKGISKCNSVGRILD